MKRFASFIPNISKFTSFTRLLRLSVLLLLSIISPLDMLAAFSKHPTSIVNSITSNYKGSIDGVYHDASHLENPTDNTYYYSGTWGDNTSGTDKTRLRVFFTNPLTPLDAGDIIVYLRRPKKMGNNNINNAQPISFEMRGLFNWTDGKQYIINLKKSVDFEYNGPLTEEYSARIPIKSLYDNVGTSYKNVDFLALYFDATKNYNDEIYDARSNGIRDVALNSFDIIKIDHNTEFINFSFENTRGIIDSQNRIEGWDDLSDSDREMLKNQFNITLPEFEYLPTINDKIKNPYGIQPGQRRQQTHTTEHIVYAMPGEAIPLYPYYGLTNTPNFKENFSHWYDFRSGSTPEIETADGLKVELLEFLNDSDLVQKSSNNGYYGGQYMSYKADDRLTVSTPQEYADAVRTINNGKYNAIIELTSDLDFSGYNGYDLIICPSWEHKFTGHINGNGHKISNLVVNKPDVESLGLLVGWTDAGVVIENLYIDNTCSITASKNVGLVGFHATKIITVRNVHTEATINAPNGQAAGIVGCANNPRTSIKLVDCFIGGRIGSDSRSDNAAIAGWWRVDEGDCYCSLINVVVNCDLHGSDGNENRKYIRSYSSSDPVISSENGVKKRGFFSFRNCYGILDKNDETWNFIPMRLDFPSNYLSKLGWSDYKTPPMATTVSEPYAETITIYDESDYIEKIKNFNEKTKDDYRVTIVLTQDLDFSDYGPEEVPMIGPKGDKEFAGIFNGAGHTIKNLRIIRDEQNVGMFGQTRNGARIENLILDSSCLFQGKSHVGIVGNHRWNPIIFRNVKTEATVRGSDSGEQACAALVGFSNGGWSNGTFDLTNVYIGGVVGNPEDTSSGHNNAVICGWQTNSAMTGNMYFNNVVVDCELYGYQNSNGMKYIRHNNPNASITKEGDTFVRSCTNGDGNPYSFRYTNCFGNIDRSETPWQPIPTITDMSVVPIFENWTDNKQPNVAEDSEVLYVLHGHGDRSVGTVATFFYPKNIKNEVQSLSSDNSGLDNEYIIAADFSQTFDPNVNVDLEKKIFYEPIIAFRHIFRIRDGRQLAEEISGSVENNKEYLRAHRKYVSARAGVPFQIRLDNPAPVKMNTKSNYYYKKSEEGYDRVYSYDIRVTDMILKIKYSSSIKLGFEFSEKFTGQNVDGTIGADDYYRMLKKDNPLQGRWKIQIVGKDRDGKDIKIYNSNEPLVLMEYEIEFLPSAGASLITEKQLYDDNNKFAHAREANMRQEFGDPKTYIDFDEYININKLDDVSLKNKLISNQGYNYDTGASPREFTAIPTKNGMEKTLFKWPVPWNQSSYSFGYNNRQDYSMYMLATHSDNVPFKVAASNWNSNLPDDGNGLFDRSYYDSIRVLSSESQTKKVKAESIKQGYFYYVNAATDPGVSARLNINELCQGSRVYVSAWVSEFSKTSETANLSFNFVAVLKDNLDLGHSDSGLKGGDRLVLHQYITGYVPYNYIDRDTIFDDQGNFTIKETEHNNGGRLSEDNSKEYDYRGQWLNVYYSFIPRLAEFSKYGLTSDMVDHYELELDNNAKNSNGADYAIDDIRAYVVPPTVETEQLTPACRDEKMRMLLGSPFETLLEVAGKRESLGDESEELDVYYTYLDKEKFDNLYYQEKKSMEEAFNASIIKYNYNISDEDDRTFGKITFNGNYSKNTGYHEGDEDIRFGQAYSQTKESGQRMIVFESEISSGKLLANKHYYVIFKSSLGENDVPTIGQEATFFNMSDPCANTCVTYIKPPIITKLNGKIVADVENIRICENQSPVIQVNLTGIDENNQSFDIEKNVYFDWFYGSKEELDEYTDGSDETHTLYRALTAFRLRHEEEVLLDTIQTDDNLIEGEKFEKWMLDLIKRASKPEGNSSIAKLALYKSSFVMPPARMKENGEPYTHYVTVLPIACVPLGSYHGDPNILVCATPTPIPITVDARSPLLRHGLTGLTYPEDLTDVPLRIGIDQLKTNLTGGTPASRRIDLPVRLTLSSDNKSKVLKLLKEPTHKFVNNEVSTVEEEGAVVLVQTNDPEYKDLGTLDKDSVEIGTLFWVGEIKKIVAKTNEEDTKQYVQLEFDNSFNFKEGYMYKFRFQYEESGEANDESVCSGQDVFTIKVVPKYLAWTGANNLNWNDDSNWRRVGKTDLLMTDPRGNTMAHYVTNGYRGSGHAVNDNSVAYAPLDFTSVIVEEGMEAPFMYPMAETEEVKDEYQPVSVKYAWPSNPEKGTEMQQNDDPGADAVGKVTPLIHYDMAAFEFNDDNRRYDAQIGCRPWYPNTCKEIHFKPGGTIMNQQELTYERAWVDMELEHSRWYTVSSPLQEVFAGDFYLPSDGARQATELYKDITFSKGTNDRFKPAVFQRGWDKSIAKVYEIDGPAVDADNVRNVAVKTFWSHVYNDVKEQYGGGVGFSIKTDVSNMDTNKPGDNGKVLFRLPKKDAEYLYYNKDGSKSGHKTEIVRGDGQYRLNASNGTITSQTAEKGKYFLVGNPFMTHMDIKKFLSENSETLEKKYWVVTKEGQIAGDFSGDAIVVADPSDEDKAEDPTIAPMQGFFVKTISPAQRVDLTYDESMMRRYNSDKSNYLTDTTRSESSGMLKIVAENYGSPSSAALLGVNNGSNWNVEAIDNRDIDIPSIVYTVGNGMALSINSVKEAEGTEIGVIADDDTETVLRFKGIEAVDGLYLLDKADHSLTPLEEGMEVTVEGAAAGRFFLTYGMADEGMMSGIEWSVNGGVLTAVDNASSGYLEVNVFDTLGRLVKRDVTDGSVISLALEPGIYVVEIRTAKEYKSIKIRI